MRLVIIITLSCGLAVTNARAQDLYCCYKAFRAERAGDYDLAIDLFSCCLDQEDVSVESLAQTYTGRGITYIAKSDYDQAIRDFNEAIRLDPNLADAYYNRGVAHYHKGDYDQALQDYDEAIRLDPNVAEAYLGRGLAHKHKGDNDQAIQDFTTASELGHRVPEVYVNRGDIYLEGGDYQQAIKDFNQAIFLNPNAAQAYYNRGLARQIMGSSDHAKRDYDRAIDLDPSIARNSENYTGVELPKLNTAQSYKQGNKFLRKGNYEEAVWHYTEALRLDPSYASAYNARGWALYLMGRNAEALADAERAVALAPTSAYHFGTQGHVLAALGRTLEALAAFERGMAVGDGRWIGDYQKALTRHGYYKGDSDGDYDPAVRVALEACLEAGCRVVR